MPPASRQPEPDTAPRVGEYVRFHGDPERLSEALATYNGREAKVEGINGQNITLRPHRYGPEDPRPQLVEATLDQVYVEQWQLDARNGA